MSASGLKIVYDIQITAYDESGNRLDDIEFSDTTWDAIYEDCREWEANDYIHHQYDVVTTQPHLTPHTPTDPSLGGGIDVEVQWHDFLTGDLDEAVAYCEKYSIDKSVIRKYSRISGQQDWDWDDWERPFLKEE